MSDDNFPEFLYRGTTKHALSLLKETGIDVMTPFTTNPLEAESLANLYIPASTEKIILKVCYSPKIFDEEPKSRNTYTSIGKVDWYYAKDLTPFSELETKIMKTFK